MSTRLKIIIGAVALVLAAAAGVFAYNQVLGIGPSNTITAQFVRTPGLYAGNSVAILGVPTGRVESITPRDGFVEVKIAIPKNVKIPANAKAILVAPNPVSDRIVELFPAYTSGAVLEPGAVIPLARTVVPLELDEVFANVSQIANTLGPSGANSDGSLNDALEAVANLVDGTGESFGQALDAIARALPALTSDPEQLQRLITVLDDLTGTLAANRTTINSLYDGLANATHQLAGEKDVLAGAIKNLDTALTQVAQFVRDNKANLGESVESLGAAATALIAQKQSLIDVFDVLPLVFQNINNTIVLNGPCESGAPSGCAGIFVRALLTTGIEPQLKPYCGTVAQSLAPVLAASLPVNLPGPVSDPDPMDVACVLMYALTQGHPGAPGAPATPDMGLAQFLGG